jgi:hypothetical protein
LVAVLVVRSNIDRTLVLYSIARRLLITFGAGHPNLNLTAEEKRVYGLLFRAADPDGFEVVSGDVAVKFFEKTKLPPDVLGQVGPQACDVVGCSTDWGGIRFGRLQTRKTEDY